MAALGDSKQQCVMKGRQMTVKVLDLGICIVWHSVTSVFLKATNKASVLCVTCWHGHASSASDCRADIVLKMRSTFLYFCFGWFSLTVPQKLVQGYFWETELKMNCKSSTGSTFLLSAFLLLTSYCRSCSIPESPTLLHPSCYVKCYICYIFERQTSNGFVFFLSCRWNLMTLVKTLLCSHIGSFCHCGVWMGWRLDRVTGGGAARV